VIRVCVTSFFSDAGHCPVAFVWARRSYPNLPPTTLTRCDWPPDRSLFSPVPVVAPPHQHAHLFRTPQHSQHRPLNSAISSSAQYHPFSDGKCQQICLRKNRPGACSHCKKLKVSKYIRLFVFVIFPSVRLSFAPGGAPLILVTRLPWCLQSICTQVFAGGHSALFDLSSFRVSPLGAKQLTDS